MPDPLHNILWLPLVRYNVFPPARWLLRNVIARRRAMLNSRNARTENNTHQTEFRRDVKSVCIFRQKGRSRPTSAFQRWRILMLVDHEVLAMAQRLGLARLSPRYTDHHVAEFFGRFIDCKFPG